MGPGDGSEDSDEVFVKRLRKRGNLGKLKALVAPATRYNGMTFHDFVPMAAGKFLVKNPGTEEGLQLMVRRQNIAVAIDYKERGIMETEKMKQATQQGASTMNGMNRSNVKIAISSLSSQIRKAIRKSTKANNGDHLAAMKTMFACFDANADGQIDQEEFLNRCHDFGVSISSKEVELVWPSFDTDGSGNLSFTEMLSILKYKNVKGTTAGQKALAEREDHRATKRLRRKRITEKTRFRKALSVVETDIKALIRGHMKDNNMTIAEIFDVFDANGGGK
jgi:hypothetical protein